MRMIVVGLALLGFANITRAEEKKVPVMHVVIFTFKDGTPANKVDEVITDCTKILGTIKGISSVKAGRPTKDKLEPITQTGYTIALSLQADDWKALEAYRDDPDHKKFVDKHKALFDKVIAYDFTVGK